MIVVDRILDDLAVCIKDGSQVDISLKDITGEVHEGDLLKWDEMKSEYTVDSNATKERFKAISERFARIKNRKKENP